MKKTIKQGLLAIATLALAAATYSEAFSTTARAKEESGSSYITVEKIWEDSDNKDGARPDSVRVRVKIDAVEACSDEPIDYFSLVSHNGGSSDEELSAEGPDGILGTDDDWTLVLSEENGWEVQIETITGGSRIRGIEAEELDVPSGYTSSIEKDFSGDMLSGYIDLSFSCWRGLHRPSGRNGAFEEAVIDMESPRSPITAMQTCYNTAQWL